MGRSTSIVKNTMILTIGKVCTQLITFFLLPLYTAILTTEEYGTVDLLNTLVSLLLPIVTFQVEQAVFRYLIEARQDNNKKTKIITTAIVSVTIQSIIYLIIFFLISPFVKNDYKFFLATNVVAYIFASLLQQIARGLGDNKRFAIGSFFTASGTIVFNVVFLVVFKLGANGMLLATMLAQLICILYLTFTLKLYKYINYNKFNVEILKKLWIYSFPLIPNAISWWVFNASNRVIVSSILGVAKNGILSAASKFSGMYITLYNIFNLSWTEMVVMHVKDEDFEEFFNKMFNIASKLFISMGMGILACMPFVFPIMVDSKFKEGYNLIPILMIGSIFNVIIGLISAIYVAKKDTKAIANTSIMSAIINIIIHLILIKCIGLYASGVATFIAFLIMIMYRLNDLKKRYFEVYIEKILILSTIGVYFIILLTYYSNNIYLNLIGLLITVIYAWLLNKKSFNLIINLVKKLFKRG